MNNIIVLLSHVPNPRMNKRIIELKKHGHVTVICVRRKEQDIWEPSLEGVDYKVLALDMPSIKQLFKRIAVSYVYSKEVTKLMDEIKPSLIYTAGLDSLKIANAYSKNNSVKIIYEIADLREIYIAKYNNPLKHIVQKIIVQSEKRNVSLVDHIVITSELFYSRFYSDFVARDKVLYFPNVPELSLFEKYRKKDNKIFTIGFIGALRYIDQMKLLVKASKEADCNVFFAGAGSNDQLTQDFIDYIGKEEHVQYLGKYDYARDIANLYSLADCIYSVYDANNPNVRIALPNKLFESIYCEIPIIVAKNTYLSELVSQWGVGVSVSHENCDDLVSAIKLIRDNKNFYSEMGRNCTSIKSTQNINIFNANFNIMINNYIQE